MMFKFPGKRDVFDYGSIVLELRAMLIMSSRMSELGKFSSLMM